jgi:hypothetical protein
VSRDRSADGKLVDPLVNLRDLPEREREEFLRQYQTVNAAHDPAGYRRMRSLTHVWGLTAIAAREPGYYEELAAACAGTATTAPITNAIPDWAERAAGRERKADTAVRLTAPRLVRHSPQGDLALGLRWHALGDAETYAWKRGK